MKRDMRSIAAVCITVLAFGLGILCGVIVKAAVVEDELTVCRSYKAAMLAIGKTAEDLTAAMDTIEKDNIICANKRKK